MGDRLGTLDVVGIFSFRFFGIFSCLVYVFSKPCMRVWAIFCRTLPQLCLKINWRGGKNGENNLAKKVYPLPMVGIELGSREFKSKSSNHWPLEDECWKTKHNRSIHFTAIQINWWMKSEMDNVDYCIDSNRIFSPILSPLMHIKYWWLPYDMNCFRYVGQVIYFKLVGAHDLPIINIRQPIIVIHLTKYSLISTFSPWAHSI